MRDPGSRIDEIRRQLMWARVIAVVEEQARALRRTAFSATVREAGDLSAGVFDTAGQMVAQAVTGTPGHVNSMAEAVKHFLAKSPIAGMREGDHFITNDPWLSSGHLHDVTVVSPIFRAGRPIALFACTCHQVDIGGLGQGPDGRSIYEEGLCIPIMPLARQGEMNEDLLEIVRHNVRQPYEVEGDIRSYVTSNELGGRRLLEMLDEFEAPDLDDLAAFVFERSRAAMVAAIRRLPEGVYRNRMTIDGHGEPIELVATMTVGDDRIAIDYTGSPRASRHGINVVLNYCKAYSAFGVRAAVAPAVPNNAGSLAPILVTAPEGSILNVSRPWPVSARHIIGQFLPDVVLGCLAQAMPGRIPAEGASCVWGVQMRGGPEVVDPTGNVSTHRFDLLFFNSGGSGARPTKDGLSATAFPSGIRALPVEAIEATAPVVIWRKELRPDSGGGGEYRGGLGQVVEVSTLDGAPFAVFAMYDRIENPARGRSGGGAGAPGTAGLASGGALRPMGQQTVARGERLRLELPGCGGYGDPRRRPAERVAADVRQGLVSREQAATVYGVVCGPDGGPVEARTPPVTAPRAGPLDPAGRDRCGGGSPPG
jgi:N-methylhydantoinase B/oxoprolinase/acetone carboxylase alpha subunit